MILLLMFDLQGLESFRQQSYYQFMYNNTLIPFTSVPTGSLEILDTPVFIDSNLDTPLKFSLILPSYNESNNIQEIINILNQLLERTIPEQYELIVVDDNSPDRTFIAFTIQFSIDEPLYSL